MRAVVSCYNCTAASPIDLYHMRSQALFHTGNLEKSLFLEFEIESNMIICSIKPLSVQQYVKNFYFGVPYSV